MAPRHGGIQDLTITGSSTSPAGTRIGVSYKIPYRTLGFSQETDFWSFFLDQSGSFAPVLANLKELLQRNTPFIEPTLVQQFGPASFLWKWLVSPDADTRQYSLAKCTPDLVLFTTSVEVAS